MRKAFNVLVVCLTLSMLSACRPAADAGRGVLRNLSGATLSSIEVDGTRLAYMERAADGPTLILLHGFASEKDSWLRFLRKIPRHYRVIALDLPGHGESSMDPDRRYTITAMLKLVESAILQLDDGPTHLAGTSLGGMIATLYTARNPARVSTLSLYAPAGVYPPTPSEFQLMIQQGKNPLIANTREDFDRLIEFVFHKPPPLIWPIGPAIRKYAIERAPFHQKIWNDFWPDHPTLNEHLPGIDVPVMLVWGDKDRILDVSSTEVFESLLPQVETIIVENLGHATVNERPSEMARLQREFLARQTRL